MVPFSIIFVGEFCVTIYNHLNIYDTSKEYAEDPESDFEGENWIEPSAEVSETSMIFTFAIHVCYNDYDYTRFVATYTPNN